MHETLVAVGDAGQAVEDKARAMAPEKMPSVLRVPRDEDRACFVEHSLPKEAMGKATVSFFA